jgi:phage I-like protein
VKKKAPTPRPGIESLAIFHVELFADAEKGPPSEFRLWQAGDNPTTKGTVLFDDLAAVSVETHAQEWGVDFMIDYEHASLGMFIVDPAESGKAAGWFKPAVRDGALWATDVRWTEPAAEKIRRREFRYISPAGETEATADGRLRFVKLWNAALTNTPATRAALPLAASARVDDQKETPMEKFAALLGLAASAAQAEIESTVAKLAAFSKSILDLTGKASADEALGVLQAYKAGAEQTAKLQAELGEIKASAEKAERAGLIASALADGKLSPAMKTWAETQSTAALRAFLEVAPKLVAEPKQEKVDPAGSITASEAKVASMLGVKPEQLATYRKETSAK